MSVLVHLQKIILRAERAEDEAVAVAVAVTVKSKLHLELQTAHSSVGCSRGSGS